MVNMARRTEVHIEIEGTDVTAEIANYLDSFTYLDSGGEEADDIQFSIHDRESLWLNWLDTIKEPSAIGGNPPTPGWKIGDEVTVTGTPQEDSYGGGRPGIPLASHKGKITYLNLKEGIAFPIHVDQKGWFRESEVKKTGDATASKQAAAQTTTEKTRATGASDSEWKVGDKAVASGAPQYTSYGEGRLGIPLSEHHGSVTYLNLKEGIPYPIHIDQKGWFSLEQVKKDSGEENRKTGGKGAIISAFLVQRNWDSDGKDKVLDCGVFELDTVNLSGPPDKFTLKALSAPRSSPLMEEATSKTWENIRLSAIAEEMAKKSGLKILYLAKKNPLYKSRNQSKTTDATYLHRLCEQAKLTMKITAASIVVYDNAEMAAKEAVRTITNGDGDVLSKRLSTSLKGKAYSSCKVSYTDPLTDKTIEYIHPPQAATPKGQKKSTKKEGPTLNINEKVESEAEAKDLAIRRFNQAKEGEYEAEFTLIGDLSLVNGVVVMLKGFSFFDGRYLVETASHNIVGGYTVSIKLSQVWD